MAEGNKTTLGITENLEALLCYVMGWVTGAIFLFIEKENRFVRFHAMQSLVTFLALSITMMVLLSLEHMLAMPFIYHLVRIVTWLVNLLTFLLWIMLMVKAWRGESYRLPVAGDFAAKQIGLD